MLPSVMKRPTAAGFNARVIWKSEWHKHQKEGTVTSYCAAVSHFCKTYDKDDIIAETDANMIKFTQSSNESPTEYAEAMWNKALRFDRVYDKCVLKAILLKDFWNLSATV